MILLLILAAWAVLLVLVAGLCAGARLGDDGQRARAEDLALRIGGAPRTLPVHEQPLFGQSHQDADRIEVAARLSVEIAA